VDRDALIDDALPLVTWRCVRRIALVGFTRSPHFVLDEEATP